LRRILEARQLGLKFIANVTYGYTSASHSGRMPAVEIADSIVQAGRETLEKVLRYVWLVLRYLKLYSLAGHHAHQCLAEMESSGASGSRRIYLDDQHIVGRVRGYRQLIRVSRGHISPSGRLTRVSYLPGRTKDQAFQIGNDIAATVTALNPSPIKLKFEKVIFVWTQQLLLSLSRRYIYRVSSSQRNVTSASSTKTQMIRILCLTPRV
jgi:DNA polymerase zeta